jgi:hypothetical protein
MAGSFLGGRLDTLKRPVPADGGRASGGDPQLGDQGVPLLGTFDTVVTYDVSAVAIV